MTQLPSVLQPPLLLATDGSTSARVAQALIRPIAELLQPTSPPERPIDEQDVVLTVVTVQTRAANRGRRSPKKLQPESNRQIESTTNSTKAEAATAVQNLEHQTVGGSTQTVGLSLEQLTELVQADFSPSFSVSLLVRQGRPATEILNCARTIQAGLIAIGHRGTGGVRELLLGSVSTAIARYAPCSVLLARTHAEASTTANLRHVLLLVDAVAAQGAVALIQQLIPAGIQTVTLLHVQAPLNTSYSVTPFISRTSSWQLSRSLQAAQQEQGEQILQRAVAAIAVPGLTVQTRLHTGDAGPGVCHIAAEIGANLIVLGSDPTRRSLLSPFQTIRQSRQSTQPNSSPVKNVRPILRNTRLSVTEDYVIHYAPCPVLLCRATAMLSNSGNTVK